MTKAAEYKTQGRGRGTGKKAVGDRSKKGKTLGKGPLERESRRLCFFMGTLIQDYLTGNKSKLEIRFGPEDYAIGSVDYGYDLAVMDQADGQQVPVCVFEILPKTEDIFYCLDAQKAFLKAGCKEYVIVDCQSCSICICGCREVWSYGRFSFDQDAVFESLPGFTLNMNKMLESSEDHGIRELGLFFRFSRKLAGGDAKPMLGEDTAAYLLAEEDPYNAESFYRWLQVRKEKNHYTEQIELLAGKLSWEDEKNMAQLRLQGGLYFAIKSHLNEKALPYEILFAPACLELTGEGILDSVVSPDLFVVERNENEQRLPCKLKPLLIIEIVTPASAVRDYVDKAQIYQFHHVAEYWIVNTWKKQLLIMNFAGREPVSRIVGFSSPIRSGVIDGLSLCLDELSY